MGGRYLLTGVQIGLLKTAKNDDLKKLVEEIEENQFIGNNNGQMTVKEECKMLFENFGGDGEGVIFAIENAAEFIKQQARADEEN